MYYLSSYHPLVSTKLGREASLRFNIPPFVDGSCRREPDFENSYPSITALCHASKFAPRLQVDDFIVFITKKGIYLNIEKHWRLTAILKVKNVFENHQIASEWYINQNVSIPSNCMINNNFPNDYNRTIGHKKHKNIREWDLGYKSRSRRWPVFVVTDKIFVELNNPPVLTEEKMIQIFGRIPVTRNPPSICRNEFEMLKKMTD